MGVKVFALDNCVPVQVASLAELVYSILLRPKITENLDEVNSWTMFMRHFSYIKMILIVPIPACFSLRFLRMASILA